MLLRGLASASNGMQALIEMNDSIANNIANVNTTGYKKENIIFKNIYDSAIVDKVGGAQSQESRALGELSVGSQVQKMTYDFSQGALSRTDNPFDLAVEGDGFFKVQSPDGTTSYTRNGSFVLNNQAFLVTKEGDYVLDNEGKRVQINLDGLNMRSLKDVIIGIKGQIEINNEKNKIALQTIGIYDFKNKEDMTYIGSGKFKPANPQTNPEIKAEKYGLQQGALEMSNSNVVNEMIRSISTSRNYETLSKLVKENSATLSQALQVGRVRSY